MLYLYYIYVLQLRLVGAMDLIVDASSSVMPKSGIKLRILYYP